MVLGIRLGKLKKWVGGIVGLVCKKTEVRQHPVSPALETFASILWTPQRTSAFSR